MEQCIVADMYRIYKSSDYEKGAEASKEEIRKGMKVTVDYFEEVNSCTKENGLLLIKDEEATKERLKLLSGESVGATNDSNTNTELDELRAKYKELAQKDANKLWKEMKLKSEIELLSKQD